MKVTHSLRGRLLWFLLAAITLAALAQASIAYRTALDDADQIFDYHMQQMALSLRSSTPLSNTEANERVESAPGNDDLVVQMWSPDGVQVFHSVSRARLPQRAVLGFSNLKANGTTYRVFSIQTNNQTVQVAQDLAVRRNMAGNLALRTLGPIAVMMPILMVVVWWVVSGSLEPVARVRSQVARRQADDLSPVSEAGLPDEVRPLVHELNLLFGRVRTAFDAQQNFVADAAHELRTPLAALRLQAQSLDRAADPDARKVAVGRLTAGIDRATRLVEQLLVLARQEASAANGVATRPVDLAELARRTVGDLVGLAQAKEVDLGLQHADAASVEGQLDALHILLRNLVENAVKYTPHGGTVDIAVRADKDSAEVIVEDSGPGIPPEERERVFDRFYRVAGSDAAGSGLGLAIIKAIAERHGASLKLGESARLGGLMATVRFPLAKT
ncbi:MULTISPECIES: ATP-binding protein [unclassified Massilia]|uniref:ATP-binding protein n=1 Tax=unclassified Massilia TaxID=2609279 RepID=UPI001785D8B7|nr:MULTISPECIES: ATP-binding protein [unclassified Massilia]MBD8528963.1 sensor histidine kinase N-terminal domain-containing protein [Massilia sp. CFBP 13647]MBD8673605.1 sensor histidine kinase N-terminal domain-containing protein [Massilia sp. CFBP 13721]